MRTGEEAEAKGAQRDGEQAREEILTELLVNLRPGNCKQTKRWTALVHKAFSGVNPVCSLNMADEGMLLIKGGGGMYSERSGQREEEKGRVSLKKVKMILTHLKTVNLQLVVEKQGFTD